MAVCCCSMTGTSVCQHCINNPMAMDVWTNMGMVMTDHAEVKPFGTDLGGCLICEKPSTANKSITNGDRIRMMTDEKLAEWFIKIQDDVADYYTGGHVFAPKLPTMENSWLDWLKQKAEEGE